MQTCRRAVPTAADQLDFHDTNYFYTVLGAELADPDFDPDGDYLGATCWRIACFPPTQRPLGHEATCRVPGATPARGPTRTRTSTLY